MLRYLAVQVEDGGGGVSAEEEEGGGQADGLYDEEQIVDQHPHQHQPPGLVATRPPLAQRGARHVHAQEHGAHARVGQAGHIPVPTSTDNPDRSDY